MKRVIFLIITSCMIIQCANTGSRGFDSSDKSICVGSFAEVGDKNMISLKNAGWKVYEQTFLKQTSPSVIEMHMEGDPQCKRFNQEIRYIVGRDSAWRPTFLGCINWIGGGGGNMRNYTFYLLDVKTGNRVFSWSETDCSPNTLTGKFYNELIPILTSGK